MKSADIEISKGKNLVGTWGKVLVTSGHTDYEQNLWTSGLILHAGAETP